MKQIADWLDSTTYEPLYVCTYVPLYLCTSLLLYLSTYYVPLYLLCTSLPSMYLSTYVPLYLCTSLPMYLSNYVSTYLSRPKIFPNQNSERLERKQRPATTRWLSKVLSTYLGNTRRHSANPTWQTNSAKNLDKELINRWNSLLGRSLAWKHFVAQKALE